jgi:enterochelin esterase family protein
MRLRISSATFSTLAFCVFALGSHTGQTQDLYSAFHQDVQRLSHAKDAALDTLWSQFISKNKIPLTCEDSVAFLYRGRASSVNWMGDFNGWGYNKEFNSKGKRIPDTDLWILKTSMPKDSRLDYKILLNNKDWIIDPANHSTQWSGVGGGSINSELAMPYWKEDSISTRRLNPALHGMLRKDILFSSRELGYQMTYSVYFPMGYRAEERHTIIYVTDGYEYMHDRMGNMIAILDNLIALQKIRPVIAVFIDHREPINRSANRRMIELSMNEKYVNFITGKFIPEVEKDWNVAPAPRSRVIIGNSAGGLFATWLSFSHPDLFPLLGIQSPAFSFQPQIYKFVEDAEKGPAKIFMTTGLINDSRDAALKMKEIFKMRSWTFDYKEVNQGHSWGNWRDLTDDLLIYLLN